MTTNGIDATTGTLILAAINGGTAFTITTPLRVLFHSAMRTLDNGTDTEISTASGYIAKAGALGSNPANALTFAAAASGNPCTQNSNVAVSVVNMPASTWAGCTITDSKATTRAPTDFVLNTTTTITSATAAFVAGDVAALLSGNANIPTNTVIASVTNGTTAIMSQAATASVSSQTVTINKLASPQTTFYATLGSSKTVNLGDTVTVPSGSWQTTMA